MSMMKRALYSMSYKQKLNIKISTKIELVATVDVMLQFLWAKYFLEAQGYRTGVSNIYQDNTSAMLLEKNGKASRRKITRIINIWYFFMKGKVNSGDVVNENLPSDNMWGTSSPSHCRGANSEGSGL